LMTGTSDYLLRVVVADLQAFQEFVTDVLARIPGVGNIQSSVALKQVKYSTSLPLANAEQRSLPRNLAKRGNLKVNDRV